MDAQFPFKLQPLFKPSRYKVLYGGRGGAKSWGVARALLIRAAEKPTRILCTREIQTSIADSVHRLLADQVVALGLEAFYTVTTTAIKGINGSDFSFAGIRQQDINKIKSFEGADICWVEEAQTVTKKSWDVLIPTIRKDGSEIWLTFNPDLDTDPTYVRFVEDPPSDAIVININWEDNPFLPETLRKEKDDLQRRDPDAYENVWGGKPKTVVEGAIYRREILQMVADRRVRGVPYDPMLKVHTVWDLGWNDQMSIILAQRLGGELRIIEYIEDSHRTLAEYVSQLKDKRLTWGTDYLPHDGAAKDYKTGKSAQEILTALGRTVSIIPVMDVEAGIKAARLAFPRCYFDKDKAARLVDCLKRYRRAINQNTNEPGAPLHDEHSHGADAFRYMATVADKMGNEDMFSKKLKYSNAGIV